MKAILFLRKANLNVLDCSWEIVTKTCDARFSTCCTFASKSCELIKVIQQTQNCYKIPFLRVINHESLFKI